MRVYFVRHGESRENSETVKHPWSMDQLTDKGWKQAVQLGQRLKDIQFSTIYASPMRRAQETASAITDSVSAPIVLNDDIHELLWYTGADRMLEREEVVRLYLKHWETLASSPPDEPDGDTESFNEVIDRTKRFTKTLEGHGNDESILVVSHGGFIRAFLGTVLIHKGFGPPQLRDVIIRAETTNTGISEFDHSPERGWVLHTWMDQAHL